MSPNSAQKSLLTFFFQSLTTGPDLGCSVLQGYCCFVQGPKPPILLTSELPSHQPFSPQSSQNAPPTSLNPAPALLAGARPPSLLAQVPLILSWSLALTSLSSPSIQCFNQALAFFVTIPCTVGFQKPRYKLCFQKCLCCICIACMQEWKTSPPQTHLLPK